MNIQTALKKGRLKLRRNNVPSAQLDCEILLSKAINEDKKFLILNLNKEIKKSNFNYFDFLINERSKRKPVAYITQKKDFWKYEFFVNENVLIPRPDTEVLIEQILEITKNKSKLKILDIGVGSGCVLLSILKEKKNFRGIGIDLSIKTLKICRINSHKLGVGNRLRLYKSNIDNFHTGKYDLIVSNPPYIKKIKISRLEEDVRNFEPLIALDGGYNGRSKLEKVINKSSYLLKRNGKLILEISSDQVNFMINRLKENRFYINRISKDLSNKYRCVVCTKQ